MKKGLFGSLNLSVTSMNSKWGFINNSNNKNYLYGKFIYIYITLPVKTLQFFQF